MADECKKRKASEIVEDADDSVEEAEATAQQVEVVDLTAESNDDDRAAPNEDAAEVAQRKADWEAKAAVKRVRLGQLEQQAAADLVKSAMQTVGTEGKGKARGKEAKAIAAAAAKAADKAAKEAAETVRKATSEGVIGTPSGDGEHPNATDIGGKEGKASGEGAVVKTESKVKVELGGPERTGLARDEVFERELGFHWDCSRIFTPTGWGGVDSGYVRDVTRCLTVVGEFDKTRDNWGYQTANAAGVEHLRLFAIAQSFELRLARVSFHRFDEFKGGMRELHERERLEHWTVDVGRIELCNDETLLVYLVAFVWTLVGQDSGRHGQLPLTAGRLAKSLSNFAGGARLAQRTVDPSLSIAIPRSRSRGRSAVPGCSPPRGQATMSAAAQVQGAWLTPSWFRCSLRAPGRAYGFADGEFLDVGARRCAGGSAIVCGAAGESVCGDGQGYRARARAVAAPQQVLRPMSQTATPGAQGEEEKSMAAEEEEPPRDPEDRLPSLHRS
ncbi:hypothetical protein H257_00756 [Aphanomyces astaci]|uniref:Uncharacterized protein n=1 Tax=Aphanomyces astaci TaxID=112090 RepID=W4HC33_APHAT|nr:hypothetical protein H257_00756 [Aphanomyces astaci]ETV89492.1 hypothetical protein H257_00756 [Aphanomyces astaci]|eukprot:XP_009821892.1 hypothetical protein H257_00756 [Aphanomyces astaci]